jgi:hypothetical protein
VTKTLGIKREKSTAEFDDGLSRKVKSGRLDTVRTFSRRCAGTAGGNARPSVPDGDTVKYLLAAVRQPAQSAFPYATLLESTGFGKMDASVQGATVSAERAEPT